MARKGRTFELSYKHLYDMLDKKKYTITSPAFPIDKTTGRKREVDVLIEYIDSNNKLRRISIECRDRAKVQDVTWIEQVVQKKEDLGLDFTIATTTTSFSESAVLKAKHHGIIIEQAEMPSVETIKALQESTFVDFFFFKFDLLEFAMYIDSIGFVNLRQYMKTMNILQQSALLKEINTNFLWSFEPRELIEQHPEKLDFFSSENNNLVIDSTNILSDNKPNCLQNVLSIKYKVMVVPRKISLPINKTFAVFNPDDHSNKKYRGDFESNSDYFSIGYLDGKLTVDMNLKKRRYWRLAGSTMHLNTIIPDGTEFDIEPSMKYIIDNHLGEFDLSAVL